MSVGIAITIHRLIGVAVPAAALLALASPAAAGPGCGSDYVVRPGDTLSRIAARCGSTVEALMQANPRIIHPARISVGWRLAVPAAEDVEGVASADEVAPAAEAAEAEAQGPLTVSGRIVNGLRCALIATAEGEEYGIVSPDLSFRSGSHVTLLGQLVDDPSCKGPRTLLVTEQSFATL